MNGLDIVVARRKLGLSQWELASLVGVPAPKLCEVERGRRPLSSELEAQIKMVLEELTRKGGSNYEGRN